MSVGNVGARQIDADFASQAADDVQQSGPVSGLLQDAANTAAGIEKNLQKIGQGLSDAWEGVKSLFGAGSVKEPPKASECRCGGYANNTPTTDANDTGTVGQPPSTGGAQSLESKIFELLMKLMEAKEKDVNSKLDDALASETKTKDGGTEISQSKLIPFQKAQGELANLNQLTTSIVSTFKQMKDSVIQNIR